RYMSPEQVLLSPKELDYRTDIYSLGAVMYEMLTGKAPVEGPNVMAMLRTLTDEEPIPVRQLNPAVPEAVAAICHKALVKDREQRFASAGHMAEAMQNVLVDRFLGSPQLMPGKTNNGDAWSDGSTLAYLPAPSRSNWGRRFRAWLHMWRRRAVVLAVLL